jgi:DNA-binding ferritin-like protein (Dps family)
MTLLGKLIETVVGDKRRWRAYRARVQALPPHYRAAAGAVERYLLRSGRGDGAGWAAMLEDLADLFEQSAADGTPIREIFGDDPVEFVEAFERNYPQGQWRLREEQRLAADIDRAAGADHQGEGEDRA